MMRSPTCMLELFTFTVPAEGRQQCHSPVQQGRAAAHHPSDSSDTAAITLGKTLSTRARQWCKTRKTATLIHLLLPQVAEKPKLSSPSRDLKATTKMGTRSKAGSLHPAAQHCLWSPQLPLLHLRRDTAQTTPAESRHYRTHLCTPFFAVAPNRGLI